MEVDRRGVSLLGVGVIIRGFICFIPFPNTQSQRVEDIGSLKGVFGL